MLHKLIESFGNSAALCSKDMVDSKGVSRYRSKKRGIPQGHIVEMYASEVEVKSVITTLMEAG